MLLINHQEDGQFFFFFQEMFHKNRQTNLYIWNDLVNSRHIYEKYSHCEPFSLQ